MKSKSILLGLIIALPLTLARGQFTSVPNSGSVRRNEPAVTATQAIPIHQIAALAAKQYNGDGLSVTTAPEGVRLRCVFQRLEGWATVDGLSLQSTEPGREGLLRLKATRISRAAQTQFLSGPNLGLSNDGLILPPTGSVHREGALVRFVRPGLVEEYTVSADGLRQDFLIDDRPPGEGLMRLELELTGATAEPLSNGLQVIFDDSGRMLAYTGLALADKAGHHFSAEIEVMSPRHLAVVVNDTGAGYPLRIDPTFSDADWVNTMSPGFPGANNSVYDFAVDTNGNLYVGGDFTAIGTTVANRVAKWDGSSWSALGSGLEPTNSNMGATVYRLLAVGQDLYASGLFTVAGGVPANHVAKWDGTSWSPLGPGFNQWPEAFAMFRGELYAAGGGLAKWNGQAWLEVGGGIGGDVYALVVNNDTLYAGGYFDHAGGVPANRIARWDGNTWSALGQGMDGFVRALACKGTDLYAGGVFYTAGGSPANNIAKWDGTTWSSLGSGIPSRLGNEGVDSLAVNGSTLFAGGTFTSAGGVPATNVACWDGAQWSAMGSGISGLGVTTLAFVGSNLLAGGSFWLAGDVPVRNLAKWDGSRWSQVGPSGLDNTVNAIAVNTSHLYAGGIFTCASESMADGIATWTGGDWQALGAGSVTPAYIQALALVGTNLYAGGQDYVASGVSDTYGIARWDGTSWAALGPGLNYYYGYGAQVFALAVSGTNLWVGGHLLTNASGGRRNEIRSWDGNTWSSLGSGIGGYSSWLSYYDSTVYALAASGADLYVGGDFYKAGSVTASNVARWNGSAWSNLGLGVNGTVRALATSGTDLYAGGEFRTAGGIPATNIAKWNGSGWADLGGGVDRPVYALAMVGANLYAGGYFTNAGGMRANRIAKWDGSTWSALGSGVGPGSACVNALAADGAGHLYVGGSFYTAGTNFSPFIARANIAGSGAGGRFENAMYSPLTGFSVLFNEATPGQLYRIQTSSSLGPNAWADLTNFIYSSPLLITDETALTATNRLYRAVSP